MCAICHDLLYKPQRCQPCDHIFCDPCLRRLSSTRIRKCPMCREKIEKCLPSPKLSQKLSEKYTSQYEKRFYMEQESEINRYVCSCTLFRKTRFMLDEKFQRNTSKLSIFYKYEKPKVAFSIPGHSLGEKIK